MSDEVRIARDELRAARQRRRCEEALTQAAVKGWTALWLTYVLLAGTVVAVATGYPQIAYGLVGYVVVAILPLTARLWWMRGVRAGASHAAEVTR